MKTCGPQNLTRVPSRFEMERFLNAYPPRTDPRFIAMRQHRQWGRHLYLNYRKEFNHLFYGWWTENPILWDAPLPEEPPKPSRAMAGYNPLSPNAQAST